MIRLFIPKEILNESHGYLYGVHNTSHKTIIIVNLIKFLNQSVDNFINSYNEFTGSDNNINSFGYYSTLDEESLHNLYNHKNSHPNCNIFFLIQLNKNNIISVSNLKNNTGFDTLKLDNNTCLIFYDKQSLQKSFNFHVVNESKNNGSNIELLCDSLNIFNKFINVLPSHLKKVFKEKFNIRIAIVTVFNKLLLHFFFIFLGTMKLFNALSFLVPFINIPKVVVPATAFQIRNRYKDFLKVETSFNFNQSCKLNKLSFINLIFICLFDAVLGILFMYILLNTERTHNITELFFDQAEWMADELALLIKWLMGVPVGLKLNQPLAHFLGTFFLHHIYLWEVYLMMLEPLWSSIFWSSYITGFFGLSFHLSLIQDLLSTMTLHIYCFYVYAARLYYFQLLALKSLFRLFRGVKWNVLRMRVDSATYDVHQLFIGTLLFAILLFLLPTTLLFYTVFALIRMTLIVIQGILSFISRGINRLPLFWLCLKIFASSYLASSIKLEVFSKDPLCFLMQFNTISLVDLFKMNDITNTDKPDAKDSFTNLRSDISKNYYSEKVKCIENNFSIIELCKSLLNGNIIYPWIEK